MIWIALFLLAFGSFENEILYIKHYQGQYFYIGVKDSGVFLYDFNSKQTVERYEGQLKGIPFVTDKRILIPEGSVIKEFYYENQIIKSRFLNISATDIFQINITSQKYIGPGFLVIQNSSNLKISFYSDDFSTLVNSTEIPMVRYYYIDTVNSRFIGIGDKIYVIGPSQRVEIDIQPTGVVTYRGKNIYIPWYENLFIYDINGYLKYQKRYPKYIYGALEYDDIYVYTIDSIYKNQTEIKTNSPIWLKWAPFSEFDVVLSTDSTFSIYKDNIAKYNFEFDNIIYLRYLNLFVYSKDKNLSVNGASGCYIALRNLGSKCKKIEVPIKYIGKEPVIIINNEQISYKEYNGYIDPRQYNTGIYNISCIVRENNFVNQDSVRFVVLDQGELIKMNVSIIHNNSLVDNENTLPINSELEIKAFDQEGNPIKVSVKLNDQIVSKIILSNPGTNILTIEAPCYEPVTYTLIAKSPGLPIFQIILGIIGFILAGLAILVLYLKFIKKAL